MIKYVVIPERREVVAMINDTAYSAIERIEKLCNKYFPENSVGVFPIYTKYKMPYRFKAIAKCHPSDEWDEEVGKQVAREKVLNNYYNSLDKRVEEFVNDLSHSTMKLLENY